MSKQDWSALEALINQERKYHAVKHWLKDNHPEAFNEYIAAFYSNDIALTGCASESEYVGCEDYPDYERRDAENDPNGCVARGWCECGI